MSIFGGQPSITTPMPPPCDSPNVVTRKICPKLLPIWRKLIVVADLTMWERPQRRDRLSSGRSGPPTLSDRFERSLEIVDQIPHVLDADREPNEGIADADRFALFFRHRGMRHEGGMIDQAFHAAQAFGERKEMRVFQKAAGASEIGFQKRRHDSAKAAHLRTGEIVLRMGFKTGITHRLDILVILQPARDLECVRAVALHSQRQSFQAPQDKKAVEGAGDRAN